MISWSRSALATLRHIHATIAADQPAAATRIVAEIRSTAAALAKNPRLGLSTKRRGVFYFSVPQTKYVLLYRVEGNAIAVVLIFHGAQNWKRRWVM